MQEVKITAIKKLTCKDCNMQINLYISAENNTKTSTLLRK